MNRIRNIDLSGYVVAVLVCFMMGWPMSSAVGQEQGQYGYRFLKSRETTKMQRKMNALAADGFRFAYVASRPQGLVDLFVITQKNPGGGIGGGMQSPRYQWDLFVIMQKNRGGGMQSPRYQYKVLGTARSSTMRKELLEELASEAGFSPVGMTAATEIVVVLERRAD